MSLRKCHKYDVDGYKPVLTNAANFGIKVSNEFLSSPRRVVHVVDVHDGESEMLDGLETIVDYDAPNKVAVQLVEHHLSLPDGFLTPVPCLWVLHEDEALRVRF